MVGKTAKAELLGGLGGATHPKERLKSVFTVGPTAALAHRQINFLSL